MGYIDYDLGGRHMREYLETIPTDLRDWRKLEPDVLSKVVLVLPELLKRVETMEKYLAEGARTPFVRASHRFSADLQDPNEILNGLNTRLETLEKALATKTAK
jgi:hypothetical protein